MIGKTLTGAAVVAYTAKALKLESTAEIAGMQAFMSHCATFNLSFAAGVELQSRFGLYQNVEAEIEAGNADSSHTFTMAHNIMSTMSVAEKNAMHGLNPAPASDDSEESDSEAPALAQTGSGSIDWRELGAVNAVVSQGNCGSCWAFAAIAPLESINFNSSGELVKLSEQQLTSCDENNHGCNGGWMNTVWGSYTSNTQLMLDADYPYVSGKNGQAGNCQAAGGYDMAYTTYASTKKKSAKIMAALDTSVVAVAVNAGCNAFYQYSSGTFNGRGCGTSLDHGVALVGYGDGYYILRNSWGTSWGLDGYMKIASTTKGKGTSGVQMAVSWPKFKVVAP